MDLTGLGMEISGDLSEAVEKDENETYVFTFDPGVIYQLRGDETAYRFLNMVGDRFRKADNETDKSSFRAFYLSDSEAYGSRYWSQMKTLADAELDLEQGSYNVF